MACYRKDPLCQYSHSTAWCEYLLLHCVYTTAMQHRRHQTRLDYCKYQYDQRLGITHNFHFDYRELWFDYNVPLVSMYAEEWELLH